MHQNFAKLGDLDSATKALKARRTATQEMTNAATFMVYL